MTRAWACAAVLALSSCTLHRALAPVPFGAGLSQLAGFDGWYQQSILRLPARELSPVELLHLDCPKVSYLLGSQAGPVVVLVHGVDGFGPEWEPMYRALSKLQVRAIFQFWWAPAERYGYLSWQLSTGVSRLLQCAGTDGLEVLVLAHSAGGVIAASASSRISVPNITPRAKVEVVTISSPLGGLIGRQTPREVEDGSTFDALGSERGSYPPAALGVEVIHVRTQFPGDTVMKPAPDGHRPNDRAATVEGARLATLSPRVTHDGAIAEVARHLEAGDFDAWVTGLEKVEDAY